MAEWKWQERMCALVEAEGRPDGIILTVLSVGEDHIIGIDYDLHAYGKWSLDDVKPHWDDPATLGCLLQQTRDAYKDPHLVCEPDLAGNWEVNGVRKKDHVVYNNGAVFDTEADALKAALKAAP